MRRARARARAKNATQRGDEESSRALHVCGKVCEPPGWLELGPPFFQHYIPWIATAGSTLWLARTYWRTKWRRIPLAITHGYALRSRRWVHLVALPAKPARLIIRWRCDSRGLPGDGWVAGVVSPPLGVALLHGSRRHPSADGNGEEDRRNDADYLTRRWTDLDIGIQGWTISTLF